MSRHTFALFVSLALGGMALGQSTAFTYQGELRQAGVPVTGPFDLRLKLFDVATNGTQIGSTICVNNVQVVEGKFTALVDFGQSFVSSAQRFIEVDVRADTGLDCASVAGFVSLTPRQTVTATPVAAHAKSAFSLAAADGSPANAVVVDNDGKVGIGTTTPTHTIHVASSAPTMALQDTDSSGSPFGQQVGYVSYRDNLNTERGWVGYGTPGSPDFTIFNARSSGKVDLRSGNGGQLMLTATGDVGIGTGAPTSKLEVRGDIRMGTNGSQFAARGEENLRIIRGTVNTSNGAISDGTGFTVTIHSAGRCSINFTTPFSDFPTSVAIVQNSAPTTPSKFVETAGFDTTRATFQVIQRSNGDYVDGMVEFIIIGPR